MSEETDVKVCPSDLEYLPLQLQLEWNGRETAMSGNDFWTSGTGTGNGKFHCHISGMGIQVENSNPIFRNRNGNENSIPIFGNGNDSEKFPFLTFGTGIGGRYSREFPGTGIAEFYRDSEHDENSRSQKISWELATRVLARPREILFILLFILYTNIMYIIQIIWSLLSLSQLTFHLTHSHRTETSLSLVLSTKNIYSDLELWSDLSRKFRGMLP